MVLVRGITVQDIKVGLLCFDVGASENLALRLDGHRVRTAVMG